MGSLTLFPDDYKEFLEQNSTNMPKFGDDWISKTKAMQGFEHYISKDNHYCTNADILEKINESPYYYKALCEEVINNRLVEAITGGQKYGF